MKFYGILASMALASTGTSAVASEAVKLDFECNTTTPPSEEPNLHGAWDFLMDVGATPNFGLMAIGLIGRDYSGALALSLTAPVVITKVTVTGHDVSMVIASPQGDVLLNGKLASKNSRICGTVTYHDGKIFPMIAHKRPSTYQSIPLSERAPVPATAPN